MDFARKQLEKYGWTDGKGLGRHENGISEALKPKLKRSVAGVGHDLASDFTEHWWTQLYDKAAGNVQVEEKNGKTKKIKTKDNGFRITNNTWRIQRRPTNTDGLTQSQQEYTEYFVKTAVLTNGGSNMEKVRESESEDEEKQTRDVFKMTDEELFAACEGRTAHKGARHGLRALGKLARIERQEQMLLTQPQYSGYSHAEKIKKEKLSMNDLQIVEDLNLNSDADSIKIKKKKKKRKCCTSNENFKISDDFSKLAPKKSNSATNIQNEDIKAKKSKKSKRETFEPQLSVPDNFVEELTEISSKLKRIKKSKNTDDESLMDCNCFQSMNTHEYISKNDKKKKKKGSKMKS